MLSEGEGKAYEPRMLTAEERARRLLEDGFRLSEEGRLQAAIRSCQQAINLNPTSTSAHSLLGTLYERVGDRDGAIREYEQVLTLSPGSTVERRRLNELMGVPAAAAAAGISARTARMAVTGGFVLVALVLVGAVIFTTQQGAGPARERAVRRPAQAARPESAPAAQTAGAPSRLVSLGRTMPARPVVARPVAMRPRPAPRPAVQGMGQWLAPGTFVLPAGGRERFAGLGAWPGNAPRGHLTPPVEGAVLVRSVGTPAVSTPGWRYRSSAAEVSVGRSPRVARDYYFQGNYQRAIESYRGYLVENPGAGAASREELAWVYTQAGDYKSARQEYQVALDQNRSDLNRGHNVEAARHGARTCESAINALETE